MGALRTFGLIRRLRLGAVLLGTLTLSCGPGVRVPITGLDVMGSPDPKFSGFRLLKALNNAGEGAVNDDFPMGRSTAGLALISGSLFLFGGMDETFERKNDVWEFDLATRSFIRRKGQNNDGVGTVGVDFPVGRSNTAIVGIGTSLYIFGGIDTGGAYLNDVWEFDLLTDMFTLLKGLDNEGTGTVNVDYPERRNGHGMTTDGTTVYIFGGWGSAGPTQRNDIWSFDIPTTTFSLRKGEDNDGVGTVQADFPAARTDSPIAYHDGSLYIFGGNTDGFGATNDVWSYELAGNSFFLIKAVDNDGQGVSGIDFPVGRAYHAMGISGGKLLIFGGNSGLNDMWAFDLAGARFERLRGPDNDGAGVEQVDYPKARFQLGASIGGPAGLFIFGGYDGGSRMNDVWEFVLP